MVGALAAAVAAHGPPASLALVPAADLAVAAQTHGLGAVVGTCSEVMFRLTIVVANLFIGQPFSNINVI